MSSPSFFDKLAPELRVNIYGHIFGPSKVIKPKDSTASLGIDNRTLTLSGREHTQCTPVECFILTTSKLIFQEATQVLYRDKTVRATLSEFEELLQHKDFADNVQRIEIADCANYREYGKRWYCCTILERLQRLSRVNSVALLSDCLGGIVPRGASHWAESTRGECVPVRSHLHDMIGINPHEVICVDVGRYQLHGDFSGIQVINRRLTKMWPHAKNVPADYDVWADLESLMQKWRLLVAPTNWMTLTLQTSFRCWVGLHEEMAAMEASGQVHMLQTQQLNGSISAEDTAKLQLISQYMQTTLYSRLSAEPHFGFSAWVNEPDRMSLRHLKPGDDADTLCWATEYLAANVASFRCIRSGHQMNPGRDITVHHWAEADGGVHVIEGVIEQQHLALEGVPNPSYIREPVRKSSLLDTSAVQHHIAAHRLDQLAMSSRSGMVGSPDFVPLANLCIATIANHAFLGLPTDMDYRRELDEWAYVYLKRHLLVSEWADPDMVRDISLADMRRSFSLLLRDIHYLKRIHTDRPEGLDADLFIPLAWDWSWEFANICAEQHESGQEVESSSDWEEAGGEVGSDGEGED